MKVQEFSPDLLKNQLQGKNKTFLLHIFRCFCDSSKDNFIFAFPNRPYYNMLNHKVITPILFPTT